jgi:hypothetical protein
MMEECGRNHLHVYVFPIVTVDYLLIICEYCCCLSRCTYILMNAILIFIFTNDSKLPRVLSSAKTKKYIQILGLKTHTGATLTKRTKTNPPKPKMHLLNPTPLSKRPKKPNYMLEAREAVLILKVHLQLLIRRPRIASLQLNRLHKQPNQQPSAKK